MRETGQLNAQGLTEAELAAVGEALGATLTAGQVVLLEGPMGAGKTTLTRALARGLRVDRPDRVRSPTFNICLVHAGPIPLHHVDLFRLDGAASPAFGALGLEALLDQFDAAASAAAGVVVIEWAEFLDTRRGRAELDALQVRLAHAGPDHRDLSATATGPRHRELLASLNAVTKTVGTAS